MVFPLAPLPPCPLALPHCSPRGLPGGCLCRCARPNANCACSGNIDDADTGGCLAKPWFVLVIFNVGFVLIATVLCGTFAPEAAGSGIPEIKCFLNGIKRPGWLNMKTAIVKIVGVLFSVSATMPVGKEGPMIHSGAIVGGGLPQGKTSQFGLDFGFTRFRSDQAKRDFVAAGASAGVAVVC